MTCTVHYLKDDSWFRALEFVKGSKITVNGKLINYMFLRPVFRETFEEAKKAAAPYFEKGYGVKIREVK